MAFVVCWVAWRMAWQSSARSYYQMYGIIEIVPAAHASLLSYGSGKVMLLCLWL